MAGKGRTKAAKAPKLASVARDRAALERSADIPGGGGESVARATCYNRACADYRVERAASTPCSCRRTAVQGAGR